MVGTLRALSDSDFASHRITLKENEDPRSFLNFDMEDPASLITGVLAVAFLIYLCLPEKPKTVQQSGEGQSSRRERKTRAQQVSGMTGIMGGSVEDALISQHALHRSRGDSANADARDVATSVAMQQQDRLSE